MKFEFEGQTLRVTGISQLSAASTAKFREQLRGPLSQRFHMDVDLSRVEFMDSRGLAALIWARNTAFEHNCRFRLLNPAPRARVFLDLTRAAHSFDIVDHQATSRTQDPCPGPTGAAPFEKTTEASLG